ncbi:pilus (MSHA type) biogenesis protein MshL [Aliikangiella marina]|nr:pilus (MSHA type) biogenesis protein MshL [Aliikangiella marina]
MLKSTLPTTAKVISTAISACLLMSCQTFQVEEQKKTTLAGSAIAEIQQDQKQQPISNQEMLNTLLPPATEAEIEIVEDRFDVSVKGIDARSFLLGLVSDTPYNMVVSPEVNVQVSLQLKNVTVSEVLSAVERIYPLMVEKKGNLIFVSSAETMTAVYPVDYLNLSRSGKSRTSIAGQTIAASGDQQGGNRPANNNRGGGGGSGNNVTLLNSSEITTESKTNFWKELQESLNLIVKDEEKANIVVSPHAGIVVVRALPRTQRIIRDYLGQTQQNLDRQVVLEAKIIEVTLSDGFQSGVDWTKINTSSSSTYTFGQSGQVLQTPAGDQPLNGIFSLLYQGTSFDAAIDLLESQGDVQVLSSPRVSTVNNQKAVIKVGSDQFFVTDVSTTTVTGTSTATTPNVTLTPFFSGISLDVTPQINRQGEIVLHIHPVVSEVEDQNKVLSLGQDQFTLPLALTNIRESDSIVRTKDQQVIVIGGLMQNRIQEEQTSTPLLGDIPVLGGLFKQTRDTVVKSELVILLKANLVDKQYTDQQLEEIKQRYNQL